MNKKDILREPLVSIITPMYNGENFIAETIESVLAQSYRNWELLITDDCSKDKGPKIVKSYSEKDQRIKLFELESNGGGAVARNNSIKEAKGEFIAFLDSDDLWVPEKLKKQINWMIENKYDFTYSVYQHMTEGGELKPVISKIKDRIDYNDMLRNNCIGCLTAIYNAKKLGKIYMPIVRVGQDFALWLQVLKKSNMAYGLNENLAYYRIRNGSVSRNKFKKMKYMWDIYREIEKLNMIKSGYYLIYDMWLKVFKLKEKRILVIV